MLSHFRLAQELGARRYFNETLFPAEELGQVFTWARTNGRVVENIDPLILGPGYTEPSMMFERYRSSFPSGAHFEADCLASSKDLIAYADSRGGEAFYNVWLDDSGGHQLRSHPSNSRGHERYLAADVAGAGGSRQVMFRASAGGIKVPKPAVPRRADGLWKTTCFELFAALPGGAYAEFNISPSTEWAAYGFTGYRDGTTNLEARIETSTEQPHDILTVMATIEWVQWPNVQRLALSAVIEDVDGAISYWALAHPSAKPDFHHPDSFVMELP